MVVPISPLFPTFGLVASLMTEIVSHHCYTFFATLISSEVKHLFYMLIGHLDLRNIKLTHIHTKI